MESKSNGWGGKRPGAGRKTKMARLATVSFRVSNEAAEIVKTWKNRGEKMDEIIKKEGKAY